MLLPPLLRVFLLLSNVSNSFNGERNPRKFSLSPSSSLTSRDTNISLSLESAITDAIVARIEHPPRQIPATTRNTQHALPPPPPRHVDNLPSFPPRSTDDDGPPRILLFSSLLSSVDGEACTLTSAGENVSIRGGRGTDAGETGYLHASNAIVLPPRRSAARIRVHKGGIDGSTVRVVAFRTVPDVAFFGKIFRRGYLTEKKQRTHPVVYFFANHGSWNHDRFAFVSASCTCWGGEAGKGRVRFNASPSSPYTAT